MLGIKKLFSDLLGLVYPNLCIACEQNPPMQQQMFCLHCYNDLIFMDHESNRDNSFEDHFLGKEKLERGASCFLYRKDTAIQKALFQLKYRQHADIGFQLGLLFGQRLQDATFLEGINCMIPVPLFWKKEKLRGYNQSLLIAQGIQQVSGIPIEKNTLIKMKPTASQTKMSREERLINVSSTFSIENSEQLDGKHILLVDDVLTTGATLEACIGLLKPYNCQVSAVTLAMGKN